ncbi:L-lactate permease [Verminephrobacter aporrectodeae]|uniref:L-lactate permease n=1 Tax=Verminephrobacter aporrectodeae TaxID=1110389 RepID=UPI0022386A35|nr:L-lactate permease [Verminephrobacter aporrectodeae]
MILLLRRPPVQASVMGAALAIALWLGGAATPFSESIASAVSQDTLILFASTTFVMAPGLLFVIFLERGQVNLSLSSWVKNLGLSPRLQVVFIVFGLAPLLESMTGFGVSLIATVPLLVALFDKERGLHRNSWTNRPCSLGRSCRNARWIGGIFDRVQRRWKRDRHAPNRASGPVP